jgi:hypothetical protein
MEAKYDGRCPACEGDIIAGVTVIERNEDGEWTCCEGGADDGPSGAYDGVTDDLRDAAALHRFKQAIGRGAFDDTVGDKRERSDAAFEAYAGQVGRDVPRPAVKAPGLHDDKYDRYTLVAPNGKRVTVSRASTVIKAFADTYSLNMWKQSRVLLGAAVRPDLSVLASSLNEANHADKAKLKALVREAEEAGGSKTSANLGTAVHAFCEALDTGAPGALAAVPAAHRRDVAAYVAALYQAGVSILPDMVERTTMTTSWGGVGGTFDRIYRLHDGRHVIGDLKTGKVGYDPAEMYGQFAVYQDGVQENGVYDRKDEDGRYPGTWTRPDFDVDRDAALIVHLPVGKGTCVLYEADLSLGRLHLDRCARIREERREKHSLRQYVAPEYEPAVYDAARTGWAAALGSATSREAAATVWAILSALGLVDDDVKSLANEVTTRLSQGG